MDENKPTGMILDGVASSELLDSSGEILDVAGCDISDFQSGMAVLNFEHNPNNDADKIVGVILGATKIFSPEDCENDRQLYYWNKVNEGSPIGIPIIYIIGRLFDGSGHEQAKAIAAQIRDHIKNQERIIVRFSIEGTTLEKKGNRLINTIARQCALTIKPCNRTCDSGVLLDPQGEKMKQEQKSEILQSEGVEKVELGGKMLEILGATSEVEFPKLPDELLPPIQKTEPSPPISLESDTIPISIENSVKIQEQFLTLFKGQFLYHLYQQLTKAFGVGNANVAPNALTGGAALMSTKIKIGESKPPKVTENSSERKAISATKSAISTTNKNVSIPKLKKISKHSIMQKTEIAFLETYDALVRKKIVEYPSAD